MFAVFCRTKKKKKLFHQKEKIFETSDKNQAFRWCWKMSRHFPSSKSSTFLKEDHHQSTTTQKQCGIDWGNSWKRLLNHSFQSSMDEEEVSLPVPNHSKAQYELKLDSFDSSDIWDDCRHCICLYSRQSSILEVGYQNRIQKFYRNGYILDNSAMSAFVY